MIIKGILITLVAPMSDHIANGGEKLLGNASSIKQRPDGRVYISGQKQRHALFSAMERLNETDDGKGDTYISNGDGVNTNIKVDLRADLGGYLDTNQGRYSGRRTAPVTATPGVALQPSNIGRDLLVRLKINQEAESTREQALATREFSESDDMLMSFFIDIGAVSIQKQFVYEGETHLATKYIENVNEKERRRRIRLTLEATGSLVDYANQARNATSGEPQKVLIVFDTKLSRKACRYFTAGETERTRILLELTSRDAEVFIGDDTTATSDSVLQAYNKALAFLSNNELYNPAAAT